MAGIQITNGYELNLPGRRAPWGQTEFDAFKALVDQMPFNGTNLVDAAVVPNPHVHSRLYGSSDNSTLAAQTNAGGDLIGSNKIGVERTHGIFEKIE